MNPPTESCFLFIIKTNCYAGNFERPMCGFMTGVLGECGVGDIAAGLYTQQCPGDNPWEDKLIQVADDNGCHRPVSICGPGCNDVVIYLEEQPTKEEMDFLRKRAMLFILDCRGGVGDSGNEGIPFIRISGFKLIQYNIEIEEILLDDLPPMDVLEALEDY